MPRNPAGVCLVAALMGAALMVSVQRAGAVNAGGSCAGTAGVACNSGLWCEPEAGKCGLADAPGECIHVPAVCTAVFAPVCGCNGRTYGNDCERRHAKVGKAHDGACGGVRDRPRRRPEPDARQQGN